MTEAQAASKYACVAGPFGSNLTSRDYVPVGVPVIRGSNLTVECVQNGCWREDNLEGSEKTEVDVGHTRLLTIRDNQVVGLFSLVKSNLAASASLKATRDALLPRLLSGEISISQAERILEATA